MKQMCNVPRRDWRSVTGGEFRARPHQHKVQHALDRTFSKSSTTSRSDFFALNAEILLDCNFLLQTSFDKDLQINLKTKIICLKRV